MESIHKPPEVRCFGSRPSAMDSSSVKYRQTGMSRFPLGITVDDVVRREIVGVVDSNDQSNARCLSRCARRSRRPGRGQVVPLPVRRDEAIVGCEVVDRSGADDAAVLLEKGRLSREDRARPLVGHPVGAVEQVRLRRLARGVQDEALVGLPIGRAPGERQGTADDQNEGDGELDTAWSCRRMRASSAGSDPSGSFLLSCPGKGRPHARWRVPRGTLEPSVEACVRLSRTSVATGRDDHRDRAAARGACAPEASVADRSRHAMVTRVTRSPLGGSTCQSDATPRTRPSFASTAGAGSTRTVRRRPASACRSRRSR